MKTSEVFKRAKEHLAKNIQETRDHSGKQKFICLALTTAAAHSKRVTDEDVKRCDEIIESRMDRAYTMESWLAERGYVPYYFALDRTTKDLIQAHRHAWLDLLIAEFESKGD
jgi:hypothetical protein